MCLYKVLWYFMQAGKGMIRNMTITMRMLNGAERAMVYTEHMTEAFPASELKPLAHIERLIAEQKYLTYGFYEEDELTGYAYFVKTEKADALLLDYFAVLSDRRSSGYGSRFLGKIKEEIGKEYSAMLLEVENPEYAHDEENRALRERRIQFYLRNGMAHTGIWSRVLLDNYVIMAYETGDAMRQEDIAGQLDTLYEAMFDNKFYTQNTSIRIV